MTPATLAPLVAELARFPSVLAACLPLDRSLLTEREGAERWSPLEILVHLLDEEVEDFRPRTEAAARGSAIETAIDPEGWVKARRYNERDPAVTLVHFVREREASCRWLATLGAAELEQATEQRSLGRMRAADFVAAWRMHDALHLRQLTRTLAALQGRNLHPYRIDYAGRL